MNIEKEKNLKNYISNLTKDGVLVCFSGGVDSTLILKIAKEESEKNLGKVMALTFKTLLIPESDYSDILSIVKDLKVDHEFLDIDVSNNEKVMNNDKRRCYYCKYALFSKAIEFAKNNNLKYVLDGTNMDDLKVYRPGLLALEDLKVVSPLRKCDFSKSEVRELAKKMNLWVSEKPSAPCLATRFAYNTKIDTKKLPLIEKGEEFLRNEKFSVNRIRVYGDVTRIEIEKDKFFDFFKNKDKIVSKLKKIGFKYINLDMEGFRSGSMDEE
ncbi:MAG: ATP-dependent sacrificial sulfur transferase LarE [Peptoniphilaceae bacterium]|nr:ATP-dependent sacrificial sulfur transferase LarE [Peptoniphilaceae bacterium]MDD7383269.1 ATP-dependent sacrificial sulfur transferase LarE [Peptoniphilaceae bacterium]MDY3737974.1 ATP-dependent sacrificial sulfur transferase LarE [Peptoniphilaceae bacterium]